MPVTDLSGGTLRCQPLPRNCGLRTTTHVHRYIRLLELAISVYVLVAIIKKRLKIDTIQDLLPSSRLRAYPWNHA